MLEEHKKALYAGIGVALLTKDKIDQFTEKLVKEGQLSRDEAQRLTDDLVKNGEAQWSDLETRILDTLKTGINRLDIAKKSEVEALRDRVDNLEKRIVLMEETKPAAGAE